MSHSISNLTRDDVLGAIGLQTRRGAVDLILPALGVFGTGLLLGAGLGLLFAPNSGAQTRGAIDGAARRMAKKLRRRSEHAIEDEDDSGFDVSPIVSDSSRNGARNTDLPKSF